MSCINKLVLYTSDEQLKKHAGGYPCLVNYNPFTQTGNVDDGCGHYANITFAVVDPAAPKLPDGNFDNVETCGFMPSVFAQIAAAVEPASVAAVAVETVAENTESDSVPQ